MIDKCESLLKKIFTIGYYKIGEYYINYKSHRNSYNFMRNVLCHMNFVRYKRRKYFIILLLRGLMTMYS